MVVALTLGGTRTRHELLVTEASRWLGDATSASSLDLEELPNLLLRENELQLERRSERATLGVVVKQCLET
jgi:hypothetical protein